MSRPFTSARCLARCHDLIQSDGRRYAFVKSGGECRCEASVSDDFYGVPEEQCDAECPGAGVPGGAGYEITSILQGVPSARRLGLD